ncbi:hypothetical protein V8C35DRAFT_309517 [Trichoderma chlorosporum]
MDITGDRAIGRESSDGEFARDYGYMWADWLYGGDKDMFMMDVYGDCHRIDECADPAAKATKLVLLGEKVRGHDRPWLEGVEDFIDFETSYLARGQSCLEMLGAEDDYRALGVLHAAYLHGAFRGVCRTPSGAEWIGKLGEFCAVAVHQGSKWLRNRGVTAWEMPALGEAWCKGAVIWGLVSMFAAVDVAGDDPGNDVAIERIHTVIAAHHFAGATWTHYRGPHPHKWWDGSVRGRAPSEAAIRRFGESREWPEAMVNVLVQGANHVNSWFEERCGSPIWDHTPRLKSRLVSLCDELKEAVGDMSEVEFQEFRWRVSNWMVIHTTHWRGRGDGDDQIQEISILGSLTDVLRRSRPHLTAESMDRMMEWSRGRVDQLSPEQQNLLLRKVRNSLDGSDIGHGVWDLATWCTILGNGGGKELPLSTRELAARHLHAWQSKQRAAEAGEDTKEDCPVCVGDALFRALVDNQPRTGVLQCSVWGVLLQHSLGLGGSAEDALVRESCVF